MVEMDTETVNSVGPLRSDLLQIHVAQLLDRIRDRPLLLAYAARRIELMQRQVTERSTE